MATITDKLKKKGWKVTSNMGWRNGTQTTVSYSATKGVKTVRANTLTELSKHCN